MKLNSITETETFINDQREKQRWHIKQRRNPLKMMVLSVMLTEDAICVPNMIVISVHLKELIYWNAKFPTSTINENTDCSVNKTELKHWFKTAENKDMHRLTRHIKIHFSRNWNPPSQAEFKPKAENETRQFIMLKKRALDEN